MNLVKQTHKLPCPDEVLARSDKLTLPPNTNSPSAVTKAPWKVESSWIKGSKRFRKEVSNAKARSEFQRAATSQRAYLRTTLR